MFSVVWETLAFFFCIPGPKFGSEMGNLDKLANWEVKASETGFGPVRSGNIVLLLYLLAQSLAALSRDDL